jgi:hypothetical protein
VLGHIRALFTDHSDPIELPYSCELFVGQYRRKPRGDARARFRLHDRRTCPLVVVGGLPLVDTADGFGLLNGWARDRRQS